MGWDARGPRLRPVMERLTVMQERGDLSDAPAVRDLFRDLSDVLERAQRLLRAVQVADEAVDPTAMTWDEAQEVHAILS